jgi:GT2 family glycosyltransferase
MTGRVPSPFPADLDLRPVGRFPTRLAPATVESVLAAPFPAASAPPPAELPSASIVIPTLNNLVFARLGLETLLAHTARPAFEVIVVDNGSTDGTREYLERLCNTTGLVRAVFNRSNRGFGPAVNQGLAAASGRRLVILNDDVLVAPGWLEDLLGPVDDPTIGMVGPVTNRCGNQAEIDVSYRNYGGFLEFAAQRRQTHRGAPAEMPMLAMYCVALTREVYAQIGPLDERFEIGLFEDDDYAMRLRAAGYRLVCAGQVFVHHFGQASLGKLAADGVYGTLYHANRRRWEEKWAVAWHPQPRRPSPEYLDLVARIRTAVAATLPAGARVLVISKGDEQLVRLPGVMATHFPQDDAGQYAGYYPADDAAAIAALEALRRQGVEYLLLPDVAGWWLDYYPGFARHLRSTCRTVLEAPETCRIFGLQPEPARCAPRTKPTIVVAGAVAQRLGKGGHAWVFLQYLLGFRRLGWDVLFLDRLEPEMCTDASGAPSPADQSQQWQALREVLERFGFGRSFAVVCDGGRRLLGLTREEVCQRVKGSALLLNVMGYLQDEQILGCAARRVFLDIDPGFGQMWRELGLADLFAGHDAFVTVGQNVGHAECAIPTCGLPWIVTRPPVVLEEWPVAAAVYPGFSSVVTWRGPFGPIEFGGQTYGLRVHEFRRFAGLPRACAQPFRMALDIDPRETKDLALLAEQGWQLDDPCTATRDPWAYRRYVQDSWAELMIAKQMYVRAASGWFSDRSACYLASGKPVVCQDTGLGTAYRARQGLLLFSTMEEAQRAVADVANHYPEHARAARALAEDRFDSDLVLRALLEQLGVG